jgi:predicted phosphodiesterase
MRIAVISDVHGNLHALDAVLGAVERAQPDELWCLGDLVGYGPRPNECCTRVQAAVDFCLVGNHDLAVLGTLDIEDFAGDAAAAVRWTQGVLTDEAQDYLSGLQPFGDRHGLALYHGSARDPIWEYILSAEAAYWTLEATRAPVVLVGHSHVALLASLDAEAGVSADVAPDGTEVELDAGRWLLNPGSVGQPRDGDPRAAWLLLDVEAGRAEFHRVDYPVAQTQEEIRAAGLPEPLALRLATGI